MHYPPVLLLLKSRMRINYGDWSKLSASKFMCDCDDPEVLDAWERIKLVLDGQSKCHSRAQYGEDVPKKKKVKHSRFGGFGTRMHAQQSYHEVGTLVDALAVESGYTELDKVGTDVCTASVFQSDRDVDKNFLEPHTDTHSLST